MDIKNCQIKYRCKKTWDTLTVTNDSTVRYCNDCDRGVHYCNNPEELLHAMKNDWCVAIEVENLNDEKPYLLLGDIALHPVPDESPNK